MFPRAKVVPPGYKSLLLIRCLQGLDLWSSPKRASFVVSGVQWSYLQICYVQQTYCPETVFFFRFLALCSFCFVSALNDVFLHLWALALYQGLISKGHRISLKKNKQNNILAWAIISKCIVGIIQPPNVAFHLPHLTLGLWVGNKTQKSFVYLFV